MKNPWKTLSSATVYENPWVKVTHNDVLTPAGKPGIYGLIHFKNRAVGVVPVDKDGYTWLVGQFRYALGHFTWEIPEGGAPYSEELLTSAQRELQEETGITAKQWKKLVEFEVSNSVTDEVGAAFLATELTFGEANPEETEDLSIKKVHLSEALNMIQTGEIQDMLSQVGLMRAALDLGLLIKKQ